MFGFRYFFRQHLIVQFFDIKKECFDDKIITFKGGGNFSTWIHIFLRILIQGAKMFQIQWILIFGIVFFKIFNWIHKSRRQFLLVGYFKFVPGILNDWFQRFLFYFLTIEHVKCSGLIRRETTTFRSVSRSQVRRNQLLLQQKTESSVLSNYEANRSQWI